MKMKLTTVGLNTPVVCLLAHSPTVHTNHIITHCVSSSMTSSTTSSFSSVSVLLIPSREVTRRTRAWSKHSAVWGWTQLVTPASLRTTNKLQSIAVHLAGQATATDGCSFSEQVTWAPDAECAVGHSQKLLDTLECTWVCFECTWITRGWGFCGETGVKGLNAAREAENSAGLLH